ncbi:MAG: restriction endonuclease subunit S, partial [Synergistaceae bacterium]|nr:restriction endonuclease subunit S [Synergistaceae bacterium]
MTDASPRCDLDLDLNYSNWKEFKIGDLFEIVNSFPYHTKDIIEDTGGIPYIVRSKFNNGLKYRVRRPENTNPAGVISFGAENATFFYQSEEWCSGNKMYYIDTSAITEQACQFVIVCLMTLTQKYSYDNGMIPELLRQEIIKLPATPDGKPDFKFMEQYMQKIFKKSKAGLKNLQLADTAKTPVDIRSWKEFKIGDLFEKLDLKFIPDRKFNKANDVSLTQTDEYSLPLVNAK